MNCYRLGGNVNALTLLKNHLKVFANSRKKFDIILPGNEIPEWFSHQRVEPSIKIPLPLNIRNDSQWMGVAFCCIFVNHDASRNEDLFYCADIHCGNSGQAGSDKSSRRVDASGFILGNIKEDHIFLRYLSCDVLYPSYLENKYDESETENSSTSDCSNQECDELELSIARFFFPWKTPKVKKCGVRIVYEKDLEDIPLIKEQYRIQSCAEIEDMNLDSATDGSITNVCEETKTEEEAGPQPKQMENVFSFIMGLLGKIHGSTRSGPSLHV
ncbi:hypothetical protein V6N12_024837 [Hibiscus sabdariffa]|uniref:C-JID domain-containing protein n=1 Tax=Hibiscus sabdariffa TaxID=183260 RepID=A0ABR2B9K0_9ROSI